MELPIMNLVTKLILSMPVDSAQLRVKFDEAIIAQRFIIALLRNGISIDLEEFIGELLWNDQIVALFFLFLFHFPLHNSISNQILGN
jgi:hypothetical protein